MTKSRNILKPRHAWTEAERATLTELYPTQRSADIAKLLGVELAMVYAQAGRMGLRKSAEFQATDKSGRLFKGGTRGQASQFVPGQKPWNAGMHYQAGGRSAETRFKPGQPPYTTQPIGSHRIVTHYSGAQHLERKTSDAKGANHMRWTPVTRLVWEAAHGPVPDGHIVIFKPGQQTLALEEITLDRIECISRGENARRNHPNTRYPELAKLIQLKGAITRQVNRITREAQAS